MSQIVPHFYSVVGRHSCNAGRHSHKESCKVNILLHHLEGPEVPRPHMHLYQVLYLRCLRAYQLELLCFPLDTWIETLWVKQYVVNGSISLHFEEGTEEDFAN